MLLDISQKAFFILLRAGLWETQIEDTSLFPLTHEIWGEIWSIARKQTVTGIVYKGILSLPTYLFPNDNILFKWVAEVNCIERENKKMNCILTTLTTHFKANSIDCILQKGQGISMMYETPSLRQCGDIDLYFPSSRDNKKALSLVEKEGCTVKHAPDGSYSYDWYGIKVEHHSSLFDIYDPFQKAYISNLISKYGFAETIISKEWNIWIKTPSSSLNLLLLNTHIMKHAFGHGIGLRQICDIARAYYTLNTQVKQEEIKEIYTALGIDKWSVLLHSFLINYIGLQPEHLPYPHNSTCSCDELLEIIMQGGNFGMFNKERKSASSSILLRKLNTFKAYCRRGYFSINYAPKEAFWTSVNLLFGQVK